jgi:hypothetical protein
MTAAAASSNGKVAIVTGATFSARVGRVLHL